MKLLNLIVLVLVTLQATAQNVAINDDGSDPDASAILDLQTTNKGLLLPRVTSAQRTNISSPAEGLLVYDTDEKAFYYYSSGWYRLDMPSGSSYEMGYDSVLIGDISGGNYFVVIQDGSTFNRGESTSFEDVKVATSSTTKSGTKDPTWGKAFDNGSGSQGVFTEWFNDNTEEELYFTVQIPHAYREGSDIYPHIHWIPNGVGNGGDVVWGLEYTWTNVNGTFSNTSIITGSSTVTTSDKHMITGLGTITGAGKNISSMLICRIFRKASDGSDTYNQDAGLLEIDFHVEQNSEGSRQEYIK